MDEAGEMDGSAIIAGGEAPEMLQTAKALKKRGHYTNYVSRLVES